MEGGGNELKNCKKQYGMSVVFSFVLFQCDSFQDTFLLEKVPNFLILVLKTLNMFPGFGSSLNRALFPGLARLCFKN